MRARVRSALVMATEACRRLFDRAGSIQGANSLLMLLFVCLLLYFIARTQVSEPITWLVRRVQAALRP